MKTSELLKAMQVDFDNGELLPDLYKNTKMMIFLKKDCLPYWVT